MLSGKISKVTIKNELNKFETRPWGGFIILMDDEHCKVKKLVLNPKKRFSLQYHHKRTEIWTVVKGKLEITLDDKKAIYSYSDTITVPIGTKHRIENIGDEVAEIIEVQTGTYFGEDDIIRLEDDFGRVET